VEVYFKVIILLDIAPGYLPPLSDVGENIRVTFLCPSTTSRPFCGSACLLHMQELLCFQKTFTQLIRIVAMKINFH
jgi:hypothetical protein